MVDHVGHVLAEVHDEARVTAQLGGLAGPVPLLGHRITGRLRLPPDGDRVAVGLDLDEDVGRERGRGHEHEQDGRENTFHEATLQRSEDNTKWLDHMEEGDRE